MTDYLEIDEEKHDLTKKVAELQSKLEEYSNFNKEQTPIKVMAKNEIARIIENFLFQLNDESKFNDIFVIDRLTTIVYEIETIVNKEDRPKLPRF